MYVAVSSPATSAISRAPPSSIRIFSLNNPASGRLQTTPRHSFLNRQCVDQKGSLEKLFTSPYNCLFIYPSLCHVMTAAGAARTSQGNTTMDPSAASTFVGAFDVMCGLSSAVYRKCEMLVTHIETFFKSSVGTF